MDQPDLFGTAALPPGFRFAPALVDEEEEAALIAELEGVTVAPFRFQRWQGKRETASFGWAYDFEGGGLGPAPPIPDFLLPLRDKAATFAGTEADDLVQSMVIRYGPEAGIGWHRDRPVFGTVIGISLLSEAVLRLRLRGPEGFARAVQRLPPRSAYLLTGEARSLWEHSIMPTGMLRWSITFRSIAVRRERIR